MNSKIFSLDVHKWILFYTEDDYFRIPSQKHLLTLTIYRDDTKIFTSFIGDPMRKSTTIVLIAILMLQVCTGLFVNSNESNRGDVQASMAPPMESKQDIVDSRSDDGLVAQWHFDEGTGNQATDSSENGNNGTLQIGGGDNINEKWVSGVKGMAVELDGVDDYIEVKNEELASKFTNSTILSWIYPKNVIGEHHIYAEGDNGGSFYKFGIEDSKIVFGIYNSGWHWAKSDSIISNKKWYHVAVTLSNQNGMKIYVNGKDVGNNNNTQPCDHLIYKSTIGGKWFLGGDHFDGIIDEVAVYNHTFSKKAIIDHYRDIKYIEQDLFGGSWFDIFEVKSGIEWIENVTVENREVRMADNEIVPDLTTHALWHFNEGSGKNVEDRSSNKYNGNFNPETWSSGVYGTCLSLTSPSGYVYFQHPNLGLFNANDFTIEAWVNGKSTGPIITKYSGNDGQWWIGIVGSPDNYHFRYSTSSPDTSIESNSKISLNNWHHLAITRTNGNNYKMYINGNLDKTFTNNEQFTSTADVYIGTSGLPENLNGKVDEVAIHNRALSSWEIKQRTLLYRNSSHITSTAINLPSNMSWDSFSLTKTEPANTHINVSVINNATNQTIISFDNLTNRTIDLSPLNDQGITSIRLKAYFSGNGSATPSLNSWGVEWMAENAWRDSFTGNSKLTYPYGVDEHTVGYWRFEEGCGNVARDWSGNGNDGMLENMKESDWVDGRIGKGLDFDGEDDSIDCGNKSSLDITEAISVGVWLKLNAYSTCSNIINKYNSGYDKGYLLSLGPSNGKIRVYIRPGLAQNFETSSEYISIGVWTHVMFTWSTNDRIRIFINGEFKEESQPVSILGSCVNDHLYLSKPIGGLSNFNGIIDEVRISNISRTPEEIRKAYQAGIAIYGGQAQLADNEVVVDGNTSALWHFNEGEGNILNDSSGNGNDGVIHGANWTDGVMGKGLEFDGVDDYVDCGSLERLDTISTLSIELWVKWDQFYPDSTGHAIFSKSVFTGNYGILLYQATTNPYNRLQCWIRTIDGGIIFTSNTLLSVDRWYHIVLTYNGSVAKLFIDGQLDTQDFITGAINWGSPSPDLYLGTTFNSEGSKVKGLIDEVSIYNRALTPSEIRTHANQYCYNSTLRSENITLPENQSWDTFHCNRTVPDNTYLNISIHDAKTNETLLGDYNQTDDLTLNFSEIDSSEHPTIYLQAYFQSNRTETPVLYDWAVNWTSGEEIMRLPELYEEIENISFYEDTEASNELNLSNHFRDVNNPLSLLSFTILRTEGQHINATINGTIVSFKTDTSNWTGKEIFKVRCTNEFNKTIESNAFNVTVIPVDDRPMWKQHIPDIVITEDNSSEPINLTELVEDAEEDPIDFTFSINDVGIDINISQGNMIIIPNNNWFGVLTVEMTVHQKSNSSLNSTTSFEVNVTSVNDLPITHLLYPENGSVFNTKEVTLKWSGSDVDDPAENLEYYVYISKDLESLLSKSGAAQVITLNTNFTIELDYGTYYWTVIGFDGVDSGICTDGYYTFNLTNVSTPEIELRSPPDNSTINTIYATLKWKSLDIDGITYLLYFGNSSDELKMIVELNGSEYEITGLVNGKTYYWKVCARVNNITGVCASGIWSFTVNTSFEPSYLIEVEIGTRELEVIQGNDIQFSLNITNVGNMESFVTINVSGSLKDLNDLPNNLNLIPGEYSNITVTIDSSTLSVGSYDLILKFNYPSGTKNLPISLKVISDEPIDDDDDGTDTDTGRDDGLSGLTIGLIIGGIVVVLIIIFILFLVFRRKKKEEKDEAKVTKEAVVSFPAMEAEDPRIGEDYDKDWKALKDDSEVQELFQEQPEVEPQNWQPIPQQQPAAQVPYQQPPVTEPAPPPVEEPVQVPPVPEEPPKEYDSAPSEEAEPPVDNVPPLDDIFTVHETPPEEPPVTEAPIPIVTQSPPVEEEIVSTYRDFISEAPPAPVSASVIRMIPNYNITHKLGAGGFGTVYRATHISGRNVAIKMPKMLDETVDMNVLVKFQEEAEIWRKLGHTNIVEFIEGEIRPLPYLAIELMEGGNLKQLVSKYQLNIGEAVFIMAQILDGMSFAHRMATIHRDLKPENILFTKDGIPKISDWGIGKFMGSMSTDQTIGMKGTMLYSAPEQISKAKFGQVDWTTDIFQLGIVFYEMITRQHPFYDEDPVGIIGKITGEDPVPPSEINPLIPKELDNIIMTALQKEKAKRWRSADIMHHELKRLLEG